MTEFVDTLGNPILRKNLDELQQTVDLMQAESSDEYYDVGQRNKKYGRVDATTGPLLLEKYTTTLVSWPCDRSRSHVTNTLGRLTHTVQTSTKADKFTALSSRFGMKS